MLYYYHIKNLIKVVLPLFIFFFISCAYFNTFYNAQESFKNAKKIIENKKYTETDLPVAAKNFLDEAIINSKVVLEKYPDSRWVENAYYITAASLLFKEDFEGSRNYFTTLIEKFPKSKFLNESMLYLSFCEFMIGDVDAYTNLISKFTDKEIRLNRSEKFILQQILADVNMKLNENQLVYTHLNASLDFTSSDSQKIKIYNKLINFTDQIQDYQNLVVYLDKLYSLLENDREKKEVKLLAIEYHKKIHNYEYLISEIENLLSLSSFNDKRLFLTLELAKIYFQMNDFYTAKEILYDIVAENSKKKETAEAYYLLARINMNELFDFTAIKELLEKSKDEKSSSKPGKLAKKTISKIEDLEDLIYEYGLSTNKDSIDATTTLREDSLLFYIAESFYFDFNNSDSSIFRYKELVAKYPTSNPYAPMSLYALDWIDSTNVDWLKIAKSDFPEYSIQNISSDGYANQLFPVISLLNNEDYVESFELLNDILSDDSELDFYLGLLSELYFFDTNKMLNHYIDYANQDIDKIDKKNLDSVKDKLSSYYYIMNEDVKRLKVKYKISDCSNYIVNKSELDSVYSCFEKINDIDDYYSFDSVKVRIKDIIPGSPSSFKRNMSHFDIRYNQFQVSLRYIKENMIQDSIYSVDNFDDSLRVVIDNTIINLDSQEALIDNDKINELESYLTMYESLNMITSDEQVGDNLRNDKLKDQIQEPFRDLNLEDLEIEKLKLNLTK